MRKTTAIILFFLVYSVAYGQLYQENDVFPIEKLRSRFSGYQYDYAPDAILLVFVPTLTDACPYIEPMYTAFDNYFAQGFSWENSDKKRKIQVVWITPERVAPSDLLYSHVAEIVTIADEDASVFELAGVRLPDTLNADAAVILVDKKGKIVYANYQYNAQAEALRQLEAVAKKTLELPADCIPIDNAPLEVGQLAPDFEVSKGIMLSDLYLKRPLVLAFYVAAFGGKIPDTRFYKTKPEAWQSLLDSTETLPTNCATQILSLDMLPSKANKKTKQPAIDVEVVGVSTTTDKLLYLWLLEIESQYTQLINDPNYALSQQYGVYQPEKQCNKRTVFVIDTNGKIVYINKDYNLKNGDYQAIRDVLSGL